MKFLFIILILVVIIMFLKKSSLIENFDGTCITRKIPRINTNLSNYFQRDDEGNVIINDEGNVEYIDTSLLDNNTWNKSIEDNLKVYDDFEDILGNPFDSNYNYYDNENCTLNYLK